MREIFHFFKPIFSLIACLVVISCSESQPNIQKACFNSKNLRVEIANKSEFCKCYATSVDEIIAKELDIPSDGQELILGVLAAYLESEQAADSLIAKIAEETKNDNPSTIFSPFAVMIAASSLHRDAIQACAKPLKLLDEN